MTWDRFLEMWPSQIERVLALFPRAERCALLRYRGNRSHLAQYIADTHDLTYAEADELLETRLMLAPAVPKRVAA